MKSLHQKRDSCKRKHKNKKPKCTLGMKQRLRRQLETVMKEREVADQQIVVLSRQNMTLKR